MTADDDWLNTEGFCIPIDAGSRLRVDENTVRNWARAGYIRHARTPVKGQFLLHQGDVDRLVELLTGIRKPTIEILRTIPELNQPAPTERPPQ
jgi:hypothetical protein